MANNVVRRNKRAKAEEAKAKDDLSYMARAESPQSFLILLSLNSKRLSLNGRLITYTCTQVTLPPPTSIHNPLHIVALQYVSDPIYGKAHISCAIMVTKHPSYQLEVISLCHPPFHFPSFSLSLFAQTDLILGRI